MKKITAWLLTGVMAAGLWFAQPMEGYCAPSGETAQLREYPGDHSVMALFYLEDVYPLRRDCSCESEPTAQLRSGQTVYIKGIVFNADKELWVNVETYTDGRLVSGYVPREYLACSDEDFLEWEKELYPKSNPDRGTVAFVTGEVNYEDVNSFPESYRAALYELKTRHPQWTFVRMDVDLDWQTVVDNEMQGGRSLIYRTASDSMKGDVYDDGGWYYATQEALAYYLDPRNGLTEESVFQFELLTYNDSYHTAELVDAFLNNTFMNNRSNAPGTVLTFAHIFWAVGKELNVSPFHLAARVCQEQQAGTSPLISGNYAGYEGYYNYFNVGASGKSSEAVIRNGLTYAKEHGWDSAYSSILGGAGVIASNYILKGQDTVYLQKFNVNRDGYYALYTHQYMQNIAAPSSEGKKVKSMYESAGSLENIFVFKIPVYKNMPGETSAVEKPENTNWAEEEGYRYWYEDGVKQGTEGRGKEIYDPVSDAWYWLDAEFGGRMAVNKDVYIESYAGAYADRPDGTGKWVRYDVEGHMVKGEDYRYGGWYRFDWETGAMIKGWYTTEDGKRYYYDKENGQMAHGETVVDGITYYFDVITGIMADLAWVTIDGNPYWYENGIRQGTTGRGKEIYDPVSDAWYWLDSIDGGKMAVSKDVYQESEAGEWGAQANAEGVKIGKWVRYDANGHMVKGWDTNENGTYYFDPVYGTMAKGNCIIDGKAFSFDKNTGIMY